jgi:hypothetical protein
VGDTTAGRARCAGPDEHAAANATRVICPILQTHLCDWSHQVRTAAHVDAQRVLTVVIQFAGSAVSVAARGLPLARCLRQPWTVPMRYEVYILNRTKRVARSIGFNRPTDAQAMESAATLLDPGVLGQVWQQGRFVGRLTGKGKPKAGKRAALGAEETAARAIMHKAPPSPASGIAAAAQVRLPKQWRDEVPGGEEQGTRSSQHDRQFDRAAGHDHLHGGVTL